MNNINKDVVSYQGLPIICLLQARMSSSRLPAKVTKPIADTPLVVLAAQRAANTGLRVKVVTSKDSSDDALVEILKHYGIAYFRGDLHNTLSRFYQALIDEPEHTIVVRLTGDNVFPDGRFIENVLRCFIEDDLRYLGTTGVNTGLPYGVSAEVFYWQDLKIVADNATDRYSQEHVTPDLIKRFGPHYYEQDKAMQLAHLRATIDTANDYYWINQLFEHVEDPINVDYHNLCQRLSEQYRQRQVNRLVIGCAQLGMDYGITNSQGRPSSAEITQLFSALNALSIKQFDTAQAYGNSEDVLASEVTADSQVVTKVPPIDSKALHNMTLSDVEQVIQSSLRKFTHVKPSILLHRAEHLWAAGGKVWQRLQHCKQAHVVTGIGVSVQSPQELKQVLATPDIDIIQLPFNIVDYRWHEALEMLIQYKQKRDIEVHVRSIFLQGLLLTEDLSLWQQANVNAHEANMAINWLKKTQAYCQCESIKEMLIRFVASQPWCDKLVIGIQNTAELAQAVTGLSMTPLTLQQLNQIEQTRPFIREDSLNPASWRRS